MLPGARDKRPGERAKIRRDRARRREQIQPNVGRDEVVAGAPGMQLRAEVAQKIRHTSLDHRVDVFVVWSNAKVPRRTASRTSTRRGAETLLFFSSHQPGVAKRRHVCDPRLSVLKDEPPVQLERAAERLGLLCRWRREPPGPQLAGFLLGSCALTLLRRPDLEREAIERDVAPRVRLVERVVHHRRSPGTGRRASGRCAGPRPCRSLPRSAGGPRRSRAIASDRCRRRSPRAAARTTARRRPGRPSAARSAACGARGRVRGSRSSSARCAAMIERAPGTS